MKEGKWLGNVTLVQPMEQVMCRPSFPLLLLLKLLTFNGVGYDPGNSVYGALQLKFMTLLMKRNSFFVVLLLLFLLLLAGVDTIVWLWVVVVFSALL